jgi:hypothetical protein
VGDVDEVVVEIPVIYQAVSNSRIGTCSNRDKRSRGTELGLRRAIMMICGCDAMMK